MQVLNRDFYSKAINGRFTDESIFNSAKNKLEFQFDHLTYQEFTNVYNSNNLMGRKLTALPQAIWSLTVLTTYHLASAIFVGIPTACLNRGNFFKAQIFCVLRDAQEALGRIISIFNDRFGLYLIQESAFHKNYYGYSTESADFLTTMKRELLKEYPTKKHDDRDYYTLHDKLSTLSEKEFRSIFKYFSPNHFCCVPEKHINHINYDEMTQDEFSNLFPIEYFIQKMRTKNKLKQLNEQSCKALLPKLNNLTYISYVPEIHLHLFDFNAYTKDELKKIFNTDHSFTAKNKLSQFKAEDFKAVYQKLDDLTIVPDCHLNTLSYETLTNEELKTLFPISLYSQSSRERLAHLNENNFKLVFQKLGKKYLPLVPACHFNTLNYKSLSPHDLEELIPIQKAESLFSALNESNFKEVVPKMNASYFSAIPDCHLNAVDYEGLSDLKFSYLFPYNHELTSKRMNALNLNNFLNSVPRFKPFHFSTVPYHYLNNLDFNSLVSIEIQYLLQETDTRPIAITISNIKPSNLVKIFKYLTTAHIKCINENQLKHLVLKTLCNHYQNIFFNESFLHFKLLEINEYADQSEIRRAHRRLSLIHHPDKLSQDGDEADYLDRLNLAQENQQALNAAKDYLIDAL